MLEKSFSLKMGQVGTPSVFPYPSMGTGGSTSLSTMKTIAACRQSSDFPGTTVIGGGDRDPETDEDIFQSEMVLYGAVANLILNRGTGA